MKEPINKVSCIVIGSKCTVMRSTSQLVDVAAFVSLANVSLKSGTVYHQTL